MNALRTRLYLLTWAKRLARVSEKRNKWKFPRDKVTYRSIRYFTILFLEILIFFNKVKVLTNYIELNRSPWLWLYEDKIITSLELQIIWKARNRKSLKQDNFQRSYRSAQPDQFKIWYCFIFAPPSWLLLNFIALLNYQRRKWDTRGPLDSFKLQNCLSLSRIC